MPWFDEARLNRIEAKLDALKGILVEVARSSRRSEWKEGTIMATMADLAVEVEKVRGTQASAVTLLQGLKAQLVEAKAANDPAAIQAVIDSLDSSTNDLASAVAANTEPAA